MKRKERKKLRKPDQPLLSLCILEVRSSLSSFFSFTFSFVSPFLFSLFSCPAILIFVENTPDGSQVPEIWETAEEKELSAGNLKKKYYDFAKERFIRKPPVVVLNSDKNWEIELSRRVLSEWRIKSRTRERILAIQLLDVMIAGARFIETVEDTKNSRGIDGVSYFYNQCKINGVLYTINITVKEQKALNRKFAYYYSATEFEAKK